MTLVDKERIITELDQQVQSLLLMAEADEAVAAHFRPRFEACWKDGKFDVEAWRILKCWVLCKEDDARQRRAEAQTLLEAIAALRATP